jgi:hypothetical protein
VRGRSVVVGINVDRVVDEIQDAIPGKPKPSDT